MLPLRVQKPVCMMEDGGLNCLSKKNEIFFLPFLHYSLHLHIITKKQINMKRILSLLTVLFIFVLAVNAQNDSQSLEPSNKTFTVNGVSFTMVYVEGGTFTMGATSEQGSEAHDSEKPAHSVTLSSYMIGQTEVTQALWQAVMGNNPSNFKGDSRRPVEKVSWKNCQKFLRKLNSITGQNFRLPTEAEWEFAARGGTKSLGYKYSGSNNIDDVAWYTYNSGRTTHPVGTKAANELGIYDMSGNVYEWCSDWYGSYSSSSQTNPQGSSSDSYRVLRGGGWCDDARHCRVALRGWSSPGSRGNDLGLRLSL